MSFLATAKKLGITSGTGNNMYLPEQGITRQDMLVLLYRILDSLDRLPSGETGRNSNNFTDCNQISGYARTAFDFFVKTGAINGSAGKLTPKDNSTRAMAAQILYNILYNRIGGYPLIE